jgi:Tat protein secretion system quality control protein TatD with DNase activity
MSRTGLWDSHAHLDDEAFNEDREQLIAQLEQFRRYICWRG